MRSVFILAFASLMTTISGQKTYQYPIAPMDDSVNVYFGERIPDPFQWMENPNDPRLAEWLTYQKRISKRERRTQKDEMVLRNQLSGMYGKVSSKLSSEYVR